jgi:hypothetical protein
MAGRPGRSIVQEAGWRATHGNSSVRTGKNDSATGRAKRAALVGDDQRTPKRRLSADRAPRLPLGSTDKSNGFPFHTRMTAHVPVRFNGFQAARVARKDKVWQGRAVSGAGEQPVADKIELDSA